MTPNEFIDHVVHGLGFSMGFFLEAVAMWEQIKKPEGGDEQPMKVAGIEYRPNKEAGTVDIIDSTGTHTYYNPMEAWGVFIHKVDSAGRRKLGDQLEQQGYDRHTGLKKNPTPSAGPQIEHRPGAHCDNCRHGQNGAATCPERLNKERCINGTPINPAREEEMANG